MVKIQPNNESQRGISEGYLRDITAGDIPHITADYTMSNIGVILFIIVEYTTEWFNCELFNCWDRLQRLPEAGAIDVYWCLTGRQGEQGSMRIWRCTSVLVALIYTRPWVKWTIGANNNNILTGCKVIIQLLKINRSLYIYIHISRLDMTQRAHGDYDQFTWHSTTMHAAVPLSTVDPDGVSLSARNNLVNLFGPPRLLSSRDLYNFST